MEHYEGGENKQAIYMAHSYFYYSNGWIDATLKHHKMDKAEFHGEASDMKRE